MKGLLLKDLAYISRSRLLVITLVLASIFAVTGNNFAVTYLAVMASTMVQTTFSYDEYRDGMKFILTLPVTRKQYVQSKYVLGCLLGIGGMLAGTVVQLMVMRLRQGAIDGETIALLMTTGIIVLLVTAVNIPLLLRFGAERGRLLSGGVVIMVAIVIGIGAYVAVDLFHLSLVDFNIWLAMLGLLAVVTVSLWISYRISLKIIEKKEY